SFNLGLAGLITLPGTVHRKGSGRIANETGFNFRTAIYASNSEVRLLGRVPAGADVDFTDARKVDVGIPDASVRFVVDGVTREDEDDEGGSQRPSSGGPLTADEALLMRFLNYHSLTGSDAKNSIFAGLSDEIAWKAAGADREFKRKQYSLTIVAL